MDLENPDFVCVYECVCTCVCIACRIVCKCFTYCEPILGEVKTHNNLVQSNITNILFHFISCNQKTVVLSHEVMVATDVRLWVVAVELHGEAFRP